MQACFECNGPAEYAHHVVPKSLGGTKTIMLCAICHGLVHERKFNVSALTKAALAKRRAEGKLVSGSVPYGFDKTENNRLVKNEAEQKVILEIVRMRNKGASLRDISGWLNSNGVPAKNRGSKGWYPETVRSVWNHVAISRILEREKSNG